MPSTMITPPAIDDSQLLFDEKETVSILTFFWPTLESEFGKMKVTNEVRKLAQSLLIAAIDASYSMGWVDALFSSVSKPAKLPALAKKLAKNYVKHWWKHAKVKDLEDVKIYESVRKSVALKFRSEISILLSDTTARIRLNVFVVTSVGATTAWV